jgi:hypothetical protein
LEPNRDPSSRNFLGTDDRRLITSWERDFH